MKKILGSVFFACMLSAALFAEIVLQPNVGFSAITISGSPSEEIYGKEVAEKGSLTVSFIPLTVGLDAAYILENGLTFMFNNNISLLGNLKQTNSFEKVSDVQTLSGNSGVYYDGSLLFGYTYKKIDNFHLTFGLGVAGSAGKIVPNKFKHQLFEDGKEIRSNEGDIKDTSLFMWQVGVPINVSAQYYFTNNIGVGLTISDTLGYGKISQTFKQGASETTTELYKGFANNFTLKAGIALKF